MLHGKLSDFFAGPNKLNPRLKVLLYFEPPILHLILHQPQQTTKIILHILHLGLLQVLGRQYIPQHRNNQPLRRHPHRPLQIKQILIPVPGLPIEELPARPLNQLVEPFRDLVSDAETCIADGLF